MSPTAHPRLPAAAPRGVAVWALVPLAAMVTGAYGLAPGSGYLVVVIAFALVLADPRFRAAPGTAMPLAMVAGALLFNAVFLGWGVWRDLDPRTYLIHLYSLSLLVAGYAVGTLCFGAGRRAEPESPADRLPARFAAVCLAVMLVGQVAQALGLLAIADAPAEQFGDALLFRPGGFQNTNMTAAIALLLLLLLRLHDGARLGLAGWIALALGLVVIGLTQSRAAILALVLYGAYVGRHRPLSLMALVAIVAAVLALGGWLEPGTLVGDLVERFMDRLGGDNSSDDRRWLMANAIAAIERSPLLGEGFRSLVGPYGSGSHNQIVEVFVDFGAVGGTLMLLAGFLMLWPCTAIFVVVGVLPSLMFSHNYFDTAPLQAMLGLGLAVDRKLGARRRRTAAPPRPAHPAVSA